MSRQANNRIAANRCEQRVRQKQFSTKTEVAVRGMQFIINQLVLFSMADTPNGEPRNHRSVRESTVGDGVAELAESFGV